MSLSQAYAQVRDFALNPELRVLMYGASGSGKTLVAREYARAVCRSRGRSEERLVAVNCAVLAPELAAAELFGSGRGSFTGANRDRVGLIEEADGGVLWLDEVHELPWKVQAMLLTWLDTQKYRRVGDSKESEVDCSVIASTNADLEALADAGKFKHDLIWRLGEFRVTIPSLTTRPEDIIEVANEAAARLKLVLAPDAMDWLLTGAWEAEGREGNARALQHAVYQAGSTARLRGERIIAARNFGSPRRVAARSSEPTVVAIVRERPGISTAELAESMDGCHRNTATRRAKAAGLVKRDGPQGGWHLPE